MTRPAPLPDLPQKGTLLLRNLPIRTEQVPADRLHALKDMGPLPVSRPSESDTAVAALMPLIIADTGHHDLYIIDGYKRLGAGERRLVYECTVVSTDPIRAGLLRILLNRTRPLSLREELCFFQWLRSVFQQADARRIQEYTGFSFSRQKRLQEVLDSDPLVRDLIEEGTMTIVSAAILKNWSSTDAAAACDLCRTLHLSAQSQREIFTWCEELAVMHATTVACLCRSTEITAILKRAETNAPQTARALRDYLFERRFPLYHEARERWRVAAEHINPDRRRVALVPDESFEKKVLTCRITLDSGTRARALFKALAAVSSAEWEQLLDPATLLDGDGQTGISRGPEGQCQA